MQGIMLQVLIVAMLPRQRPVSVCRGITTNLQSCQTNQHYIPKNTCKVKINASNRSAGTYCTFKWSLVITIVQGFPSCDIPCLILKKSCFLTFV